jgi:cytochrome c biogenesis protein CcmG/thiol:disulfide interchange protein DsbE
MKNGDIGNDHESDLERWVEDRLADRLPGPEWQPNAAQALARFQAARRAKGKHARTWTWAVAGALATSFSLAAFPTTRVFAQRCLSVCLAESSKARQFFTGSPSATNAFVRAGNRTMASDFTLIDASGRPVKLSDFRGKVVLLNFWATWCVPCGAEVPLLVEFEQRYRDRGFEVLGVSLDEDGWKSVRPFIEAKHVNYPIMIGDGEIARAYGGLQSVPMTLIVDRSGHIAATHLGLCRTDEYEADIQAVLNE